MANSQLRSLLIEGVLFHPRATVGQLPSSLRKASLYLSQPQERPPAEVPTGCCIHRTPAPVNALKNRPVRSIAKLESRNDNLSSSAYLFERGINAITEFRNPAEIGETMQSTRRAF